MINLEERMMSTDKLPLLHVNQEAVAKLNSSLQDAFYKDMIENSASYNTRVCLERKMRLPFLDAQTGVAQSDCSLWMHKWQRMPGLADGQLYTYPAKKWRKKRRQYLMNDRYLARRVRDSDANDLDIHQINVVENASVRLDDGSECFDGMMRLADDSKDSWYKEFDDPSEMGIPMDMPDPDDPETDVEDYDESYITKKKKKKVKAASTRGRKRERIEYTDAEKPYSCEICGIRYKTRPGLSYHYSHSHNNNNNNNSNNNNSNNSNSNPPHSISTDLALTEDDSTSNSYFSSRSASNPAPSSMVPTPQGPMNPLMAGNPTINVGTASMTPGGPSMNPQSQIAPDTQRGITGPGPSLPHMMPGPQMGVPPHSMPSGPAAMPISSMSGPPSGLPQTGPPVTSGASTSNPTPPSSSANTSMLNVSSNSNSSSGNTGDDPLAGLRKFQDSFLSFLKTPGAASNGQKSASGKPLATPSTYCDFCLGDNSENKKTKQAEELVSCADCGRSAHPTCLQFTPNMTLSVKKYRWQCIECKSCGLCGTSDNDDQLLFCDDCDRGYHMYCLTPPLSEPPEGSWSCHLCIEEYGRK